jgi:hypothetical protein
MTKISKKIAFWLIPLAILLVLAGVFIHFSQSASVTATVNKSFEIDCTNPSVQSIEAQQPLLDSTLKEQLYSIPADEPKILAKVNDTEIKAIDVEMIAQMKAQNNAKTLKEDTKGVLTSKQIAELQKSINQLRHDTVEKMIDDELIYKDGISTGLSVSIDEAKNKAQQTLSSIEEMPTNAEARLQFEAYLCRNKLTANTFLTNPQIISGYQRSLTIGKVMSQVRNSVKGTDTTQEVAFGEYTKGLRSKATIKYYW